MWVYEQDPEALKEAQQELDEFYTEQKIDNIDKRIEALEKEVEALEKTTNEEEDTYDERLKNLDKQIKKAEEYKNKWNEVKTDYEKAQDEIEAKARLGADAEQQILNGKIDAVNIFKNGYTQALINVASETKKQVDLTNSYLSNIKMPEFTTLKTAKETFGESSFVGGGKDMFISREYSPEVVGESGRVYIDVDGQGKNYVLLEDVSKTKVKGEDYYRIPANATVYAHPYASGTLSAQSGLANVDEKGNELIVPKQGRYRMMEYGDTVVPHNLSQRLFDVATNPLRFISNALNSVKSPNLMSNSNVNSSNSTINIGTIELPSVSDGQSFVKQLQLIAANR